MKNLRKNTSLMLLLGAATVLTACNSGGPGPNNNSTQSSMTQNNPSVNSEDTMSFVVDLFDYGQSIYSGLAPISPYLWNYLTTGSINKPLSANQLWDRQALSNIENGVNLLLTGQSQEFSILNEIYNTQVEHNTFEASTTFNAFTSAINTVNINIGNWIYSTVKTSLGASLAMAAESSFNGVTANNAISGQALQALLNNPQGLKNELVFSGGDGSVSFDQSLADLTCDSNASYSWNGDNSSHQTFFATNGSINPTTTCQFAHLLYSLNSQFYTQIGNTTVGTSLTDSQATTQIPGGAGVNSLKLLQQYYYTLDTIHLQVLQTLGQSYEVDQARIFFFTHLNDGANYVTYPTSVADYNYSAAESDLALAYSTRVSFVESMIAQAKKQALEYVAHPVLSSDMNSSCGLSVNQIESSQTIFSNNIPYWDGTNLGVTCNSKRYNTTITTTTPVSTLCYLIESSFNLQSSDGYIKCGQSQYSYTPVQNHQTTNLFNNYGGANPQTNDYIVSSGIGNTFEGHLDVYWYWQNGSYAQPIQWMYPYNFGNPNGSFDYSGDDDNYDHYHFGPLGNLANGQAGWVIHVEANDDDNSNTGAGVIVDDGVHAYMVTGTGIGPDLDWVIECIPNDPNCTAGFFKGATNGPNNGADYQGIVFSNGDIVASYQIQGHGDYYMQTFYNGTPGPDSSFVAPTFNYTFPHLVIGSN